MYRCALAKKMQSCFLCEEFPCEKHYEKGVIYKHSFLNALKESDFSIARKAAGKPN
jgi:antirestriction protein ArdC